MKKQTINIPLEVVKIKCEHCGTEFAVLGIWDDTYILQGNERRKMYCPYCGEKIGVSINKKHDVMEIIKELREVANKIDAVKNKLDSIVLNGKL